MEEEKRYLTCPFCGEPDFDLVGLKLHLSSGWCDAYNGISLDVRLMDGDA